LARIPKRTQDKAWLAFTDWCLSKGLSPAPAHHWTLAAYALALEDQEKPEEIRKTLHAIAKAHLQKSRSRPDRHPLIERTLKMIETRRQTREQKSRLFDEGLSDRKKQTTTARAVVETKAKGKTVLSLSATPKLVRRRRLTK